RPVRRKTRTLQREDEILRRVVMPPAEARRLLGAVECPVDLDRGDAPAGVSELILLRQPWRIKDSAPRREDPTAAPDPDRLHWYHHGYAGLAVWRSGLCAQ